MCIRDSINPEPDLEAQVIRTSTVKHTILEGGCICVLPSASGIYSIMKGKLPHEAHREAAKRKVSLHTLHN